MELKKQKIFYSILLVLILSSMLIFVVGCNSTRINVISRDPASGTRSTFNSFIGIDSVRKDASNLNSNGMILSCVNRDRRAIGYVAYKSYQASRNSFTNVKAISLDGKKIDDADYALGHTLNLIYTDAVLQQNDTLKNFLSFVYSSEGTKIIEEEGYQVQGVAKQDFTLPQTALTSKLTIGGSSSIEPLMQILRERYIALVGGQNGNRADKLKDLINIQGGGSSKGITDVKNGAFQLGMSSRELNDSEKNGVKVQALARENIVIIVNTKNSIDNLTREQVQWIYQGNIKDWTQLQLQNRENK